MKAAILGLGTVGSGIVDLIQKNNRLIQEKTGYNIRLVKAVVRDPAKDRNVNTNHLEISNDPNIILEDDSIEVIFEATGDKKLAFDLIRTLLKKGKIVITANKALLAERWEDLKVDISNHYSRFGFEPSVAGGIPVINAIENGLASNNISSIYGIINGTCNYILSKMIAEELDFEQALKMASAEGYAEEDPTLDISGVDAAHKLILMMNLVFDGCFDFSKLYIEGIEKIEQKDILLTDKFDYVIKLLAISKETSAGIEARVHPTLVPKSHLLASVQGADNAVFIKGDFVGQTMFYGPGAGKNPTASAAVSDLIRITRNNLKSKEGVRKFVPKEFLPIEETYSRFFLKLRVLDKIGVLKKASEIFSKNQISVHSMLQIPEKSQKDPLVDLVFITHSVQEKNVRLALKEIQKETFNFQPGKYFRILS